MFRIVFLVFVLVVGYLSAKDTRGYRGEIEDYMIYITEFYDTYIKSHEGDRDLAGSEFVYNNKILFYGDFSLGEFLDHVWFENKLRLKEGVDSNLINDACQALIGFSITIEGVGIEGREDEELDGLYESIEAFCKNDSYRARYGISKALSGIEERVEITRKRLGLDSDLP